MVCVKRYWPFAQLFLVRVRLAQLSFTCRAVFRKQLHEQLHERGREPCFGSFTMCLTLWEWAFREADQTVGQRVGCLAIEVVKLLVKLYQTGPNSYSDISERKRKHLQHYELLPINKLDCTTPVRLIIVPHTTQHTPPFSFIDYETICFSIVFWMLNFLSSCCVLFCRFMWGECVGQQSFVPHLGPPMFAQKLGCVLGARLN
jgi:hypothetical protein